MRNKIVIISVFIILFACCYFLLFHKGKSEFEPPDENVAVHEVNPYMDAEIKAVIIPSDGNTFGYDIYMYGSVLVHQPSRPGLPGNGGFATEEDALKVAELVVKKIRNNEFPPTVTIEDLRDLGVLTAVFKMEGGEISGN